MKTEALDEIFEDIYENEAENEEFFKLLESYGGNRDDQRLQELSVLCLNSFKVIPGLKNGLKQKPDISISIQRMI